MASTSSWSRHIPSQSAKLSNTVKCPSHESIFCTMTVPDSGSVTGNHLVRVPLTPLGVHVKPSRPGPRPHHYDDAGLGRPQNVAQLAPEVAQDDDWGPRQVITTNRNRENDSSSHKATSSIGFPAGTAAVEVDEPASWPPSSSPPAVTGGWSINFNSCKQKIVASRRNF